MRGVVRYGTLLTSRTSRCNPHARIGRVTLFGIRAQHGVGLGGCVRVSVASSGRVAPALTHRRLLQLRSSEPCPQRCSAADSVTGALGKISCTMQSMSCFLML